MIAICNERQRNREKWTRKKKRTKWHENYSYIKTHNDVDDDDEDVANKQLSGRRTNDLIVKRPFFSIDSMFFLVTFVIFITCLKSVSHLSTSTCQTSKKKARTSRS